MISEKVKNQIQVVQGDITKLDCDGIVNAANRSLWVAAVWTVPVHRAAGPELLAECRTLHGCRTGEAKITKGYRLKAKYIIHTVGPIYPGTAEDAAQLADCYRNSLDLAKEHDVHSIAFPAISTGVYGYPLEDATAIAVKTGGAVAGRSCGLRHAGDFLLLRCPDGAGVSGKNSATVKAAGWSWNCILVNRMGMAPESCTENGVKIEIQRNRRWHFC